MSKEAAKIAANEAFARLAQTELARLGLYDGAQDQWAGKQTQAAFRELVARGGIGAEGAVDARSETNIATLHPRLQPVARQLIREAGRAGIEAKVISATRTYAEQDAIYAQGRTKPGSIVTNARGGYSNHNFGIAFDIGIFKGAAYLGSSPLYDEVGAMGKRLGLEWGGDWKSFVDKPHFQLRPAWAEGMSEAAMLAAMRSRVSAGKDLFG